MVDLSALSADEQQDFKQRLGRYSLSLDQVQQRLEVGDQKTHRCGPQHNPNVVKFTDIASMQRMIGLPDGQGGQLVPHFAKEAAVWKPATPELSHLVGSHPAAGAHAINFKAIAPRDHTFVQLAARAALAGVAEAAQYHSLVDAYLKGIQFHILVWAFADVHVPQGATLSFDSSVNVLVAGHVTLDANATIKAAGRFKIDCVVFQQN